MGEIKHLTQWFVKPLDSYTNEVIAQHLALQSKLDEAPHYALEDNKGKKHEVWAVEHSVITKLVHNRKTLKLRFQTFTRRGPYGKIRKWPFEK